MPCREVQAVKGSPHRLIGVEDVMCRLASYPLVCDSGSGLDCISKVPLDRWDSDWHPEAVVGGRFGGFVGHWAAFDAAVFSISPSEAAFMDPAQRILLEVGLLFGFVFFGARMLGQEVGKPACNSYSLLDWRVEESHQVQMMILIIEHSACQIAEMHLEGHLPGVELVTKQTMLIS